MGFCTKACLFVVGRRVDRGDKGNRVKIVLDHRPRGIEYFFVTRDVI